LKGERYPSLRKLRIPGSTRQIDPHGVASDLTDLAAATLQGLRWIPCDSFAQAHTRSDLWNRLYPFGPSLYILGGWFSYKRRLGKTVMGWFITPEISVTVRGRTCSQGFLRRGSRQAGALRPFAGGCSRDARSLPFPPARRLGEGTGRESRCSWFRGLCSVGGDPLTPVSSYDPGLVPVSCCLPEKGRRLNHGGDFLPRIHDDTSEAKEPPSWP